MYISPGLNLICVFNLSGYSTGRIGFRPDFTRFTQGTMAKIRENQQTISRVILTTPKSIRVDVKHAKSKLRSGNSGMDYFFRGDRS
jgi:hypothetical protein